MEIFDYPAVPASHPDPSKWVRLLISDKDTEDDREAISLVERLSGMAANSTVVSDENRPMFSIHKVSTAVIEYGDERPTVLVGGLLWQGIREVRRYAGITEHRLTTPLHQ